MKRRYNSLPPTRSVPRYQILTRRGRKECSGPAVGRPCRQGGQLDNMSRMRDRALGVTENVCYHDTFVDRESRST